MKKILFGIIIGTTLITLISAGIENYVVGKQTAHAERFQNVYVFTDSKPVMEYEYLGTIKGVMTLTGQYQPVRDGLIKKAKKEYPGCEGVILHLVDGGIDKADVIRVY